MTVVLALLAALLVLVLLRPATAIGNCCCGAGGGGGAVCCVVCRLFSTLAREYTLTVAGITDGTFCENCEEFNGSFTLRWVNAGFGASAGENCSWQDYWPTGEPCFQTPYTLVCYQFRRWLLALIETDPDVFVFRLRPGTTFTTHYYELAATSWNCTGANIMTRQGSSNDICNNFPATVTVTAGAGRVSECNCYPPFDAYASIWSVSFSNIKGCCSPEINDTFTLPFGASQFDEHCNWEEFIDSDCSDGAMWLYLSLGSGKVTLTIYGGVTLLRRIHAFYIMPASSFNPLGANTLTRSDVDCPGAGFTGECTGWPNTIQIVPA